jgi:hypothetical protein
LRFTPNISIDWVSLSLCRISLAPHLSSDELEQRYRQAQKGIESLQFHIIRRHNQGAKPLLDDWQQAQLWQALQGPAPDGGLKRILLVLDKAGWHISQRLKIPEGIHLLPLLSHSPELQPAERLWPIVNEPIASRYYDSTNSFMA